MAITTNWGLATMKSSVANLATCVSYSFERATSACKSMAPLLKLSRPRALDVLRSAPGSALPAAMTTRDVIFPRKDESCNTHHFEVIDVEDSDVENSWTSSADSLFNKPAVDHKSDAFGTPDKNEHAARQETPDKVESHMAEHARCTDKLEKSTPTHPVTIFDERLQEAEDARAVSDHAAEPQLQHANVVSAEFAPAPRASPHGRSARC